MLFRDIYDVMSSYNDVTYYLLTRNLTPLHFMTSKVVQLRLITWEKLPLMKSDIGWVYITHSKVFYALMAYTMFGFYRHHFECIDNND
jgi:hypothetical protein